MKFSFFIALRYFFSKKSANVINIISGITGIGVAVGTMVLIVVLSVFNGLEDLIMGRFNSFDAELRIEPSKGKVFAADTVFYTNLKKCKQIKISSETIEETALVKYNKVYNPFIIKGVENNFNELTGIDSTIISGKFKLYDNNFPLAVLGYTVASQLSVSLNSIYPLRIYMPNRTKKISTNPKNAFVVKNIYPVGIFGVDQDVDNIIIMPLNFVRKLLKYTNEVTAVELKLKPNSNVNKTQKKLQKIFGDKFKIKNRYQQHAFLYKIMTSERMIIFIILSFVILIASFNIISSLTMLVLDKKKDIAILQSMGASNIEIKRIFLFNGWLVSIAGALTGLVFGAIICWLQIKFGFVTLPGSDSGGFIVDAYPVSMHLSDFIIVFITVVSIGFLTSLYPVRYINRIKLYN